MGILGLVMLCVKLTLCVPRPFRDSHPEACCWPKDLPEYFSLNCRLRALWPESSRKSRDDAIRSDASREILQPTLGFRMTVAPEPAACQTSRQLSCPTLPRLRRLLRRAPAHGGTLGASRLLCSLAARCAAAPCCRLLSLFRQCAPRCSRTRLALQSLFSCLRTARRNSPGSPMAFREISLRLFAGAT